MHILSLDILTNKPDRIQALLKGGKIDCRVNKRVQHYPLLIFKDFTFNPSNILQGLFGPNEVLLRVSPSFMEPITMLIYNP